MHTISFEVKGLFSKRIIFTILLFILLSVLIFQIGIKIHMQEIKHCDEFNKIEKVRTKNSIDSINSGFKGLYIFKFKAKPSPLSILFAFSSPFNGVHCTIDNLGVILENSDLHGNDFSKIQKKFNFDFASYVLIVFSLIVSIFGFFAYNDPKHIKFLRNYGGRISVFASLLLSRVIYLVATIFLLYISVLIQFLIKGISLNSNESFNLFIYFVMTLALMIIFLIIGAISGMIKNKFTGAITVFILWLCFLFIIPGVINVVFNNNHSNKTSTYLCELQKFNIFNDYEKSVREKFKNAEVSERKQLYNDVRDLYLKNELRKIKTLEQNIINENRNIITNTHLTNIFFPTTFYISTNSELSSMGYNTFLKMYIETNEKQKTIVKDFFNNKIESIPGLIYNSKSSLPSHFVLGFIINLFFIVFAIFILYYRYKKRNFPDIKKNFDLKISAKKGEYILLNVPSAMDDFTSKVFSACFDKKETIEISVNKQNVNRLKVFYLPEIKTSINDLSVLSGGHTTGINNPFYMLSLDEITKIFPQINDIDVLIIDNANHSIKSNKNIFVLDINDQIPYRENNRFLLIYLDGNSFKVKREKNK